MQQKGDKTKYRKLVFGFFGTRSLYRISDTVVITSSNHFTGVILEMLGMTLPVDRGENLFYCSKHASYIKRVFQRQTDKIPLSSLLWAPFGEVELYLFFLFVFGWNCDVIIPIFSAQIKLTVQGLFDLNQDIPAFKEHLRDFMVQIKVSILALHVWNVVNYEKYQVHFLILKYK